MICLKKFKKFASKYMDCKSLIQRDSVASYIGLSLKYLAVFKVLVLKVKLFSNVFSFNLLLFPWIFCCTVKPVFRDHIKQDIFLAFQTGGCLLLHGSSAESSCMSFLHYFHSAIQQ